METIYIRYNRDRLEKYQIKTTIQQDSSGQKKVLKQALNHKAKQHIYNYYKNYHLFKEKYPHASLAQCKKIKDVLCIQFIEGETLESKMLYFLAKKDLPSFYNLLNEYKAYIETFATQIKIDNASKLENNFYSAFIALDTNGLECMELANIDMNFDNIIINNNGSYTLIDFEWIIKCPIPIHYIIFRAIYSFYLKNISYLGDDKFEHLCQYFGIDSNKITTYIQTERLFQDLVTGSDEQRYELKYSQPIIKLNNLVDARELEQKDQQLLVQAQELEQKDQQLLVQARELEQKNKELSLRIQEIDQKNQEIKSRDQEIEQKNKEIEVKDREIAEKDQEIANKDQVIYSLLNSRSWRLTAPLRKICRFISNLKIG